MGWVDVETSQAQPKGKWVDIPSSEPMDDLNRSQDLLKHFKRIPAAYQEEVASGLKSMKEGNIIEKGLGALQYLTAPINAPLKALVEEPIQSLGETTGLPRPVAKTLGVAGSVGLGFVPTKATSLAGKIAQAAGIGADYNAPLRMGKPTDAAWKEFEDSLISMKTTPANPIKYRGQDMPFADIVSEAMAGKKSAAESADVFKGAMPLRGVQTEKLYDAADTFNEAISKLNIPKTRDVTPDEILAVWRDVSNKNNELQDYIKALSDREKISLAKMAMKGDIPKGFGFKYKERPYNEFLLRPEEENIASTATTPTREYPVTLGKQKVPVEPLSVERAGVPPLREEAPQRMGTPEGVEMGIPEKPFNSSHLEFIRDRIISSEPPQRAGIGEETRKVGGYPSWFSNKGYTKNDVLPVINKALAGKPLTLKQSSMLDDLTKSSLKEYDAIGKETIYPDELAKGQKVVINGEEFTHKGTDEQGNVILKDGETLHVDTWEPLKVDKILPEGESFLKPEEVKPTARKATPQDLFANDKELLDQTMKGKIPSAETGTTPLEKAAEESQARAKQAEAMKKQGNMTLDFMGFQNIYDRIFAQPEGHRFAKSKGTFLKELARGADELAGVISTRVGNIAPEVKYRLRKYAFDEGVNTTRDLEGIQPFFEKFHKLDEPTQFRLTELLSNGKIKEAEDIFQAKGMLSEFRSAEKVKDSVWQRAKESGVEAGHLENYFPRRVRDYGGLTNSLGTEFKGQIDKAIEEVQKKAGRVLTTEEKGVVADSVLRGYSPGTISLSGPTFTKERKIAELTPELTQHYAPAHETLREYVESLNRKIAANKFFGKDKNIPGNEELRRMGLSTDADLEASIGLTIERLKEKGIKISPDKETELKNILKAVFNPTFAGKGTQALKSLTYATTLTNIGPALTQIQDLALSIEKAGFINTIRGAMKSIGQNPEISVKDLGIERIAEEMRSAGSPIDWLLKQGLKWSGFNAIDKVGKESVLNGSLLKYQKMAKTNPVGLEKLITPIFGGETGKVISELKSGKVTDDIRFLMFNELSDMQPISKVEVPEKYLTSGKGKIFYALKTYQIKLFDVYRNEIFGEIKRGNVRQGLAKLGRLTAGLVLLGAGTDQIKDYVFGRTTDFSDTVIDNFLKIGGFSKYTTWVARKEGLGAAAVKTLAPPVGVLNDVTKDIGKVYGEFVSSDPKEYKKAVSQGFESTKNVPLVGKPYYWWFGEGSRKEFEKQRKTHKQ